MLIEDGTGSGYTAKVGSDNKLRTYSVIESEAHHENEDNKQAFLVFSIITPNNPNPSAGETSPTFFYMKNESSKNLMITEIEYWVESNEYVDIYINPAEDPVGGTSITPINMNFGSGNQATGIFLQGTEITGITGGTFLDRTRIPGDGSNHFHSWDAKLILPKNNVLTLRAGNGGIPMEVMVEFYYH